MLYMPYTASVARAPTAVPARAPAGRIERSTPLLPSDWPRGGDDLTTRTGERPIGERIIVAGMVMDERARPITDALVEVWQANSAGRYVHRADHRDAPIDPNFVGTGRCITDRRGWYHFVTVRPGAYPGRSHPNAWRPAHIHFSVIGATVSSRLVTQMYFPGDPLLELDPIFLAVPSHSRRRLIAALDLGITEPDVSLGYRFDIVLHGGEATPEQP